MIRVIFSWKQPTIEAICLGVDKTVLFFAKQWSLPCDNEQNYVSFMVLYIMNAPMIEIFHVRYVNNIVIE